MKGKKIAHKKSNKLRVVGGQEDTKVEGIGIVSVDHFDESLFKDKWNEYFRRPVKDYSEYLGEFELIFYEELRNHEYQIQGQWIRDTDKFSVSSTVTTSDYRAIQDAVCVCFSKAVTDFFDSYVEHEQPA